MQTRVGISGWTYTPWRGTFYPKKLRQRDELSFASRCMNSIEINGTFYSLQRPASFATWYEQTPEDFVFSLKGGRYITHMKRLKGGVAPLANFFASGILRLREKLGPILWQLPPNFKFNEEQFEAFFKLLPGDTTEAAKLAKHHDERMKGRTFIKAEVKQPMRYAMEVRHDSFATPAFIDLLRRHRIALCVADTAGKWPFMEDVTADFIYVRLHGDEQLYVSGYTDDALSIWAKRIEAWRQGKELADAQRVSPKVPPKRKTRDVYVYFDNDVKVRSPADAMNLARRLGIETPDVKLTPSGEIMEKPRESWPAVRARPKSKAPPSA